DMRVDAGYADAGQLCRAPIDRPSPLPGYAELVLCLPGGDFTVRPGVDIGIDAQRYRRGLAERRCARRQKLKFRLGLNVEAENAGLKREVYFPRGLADTGKYDLPGGNAGGQRSPHLTLRDDVGAGAEPGQRCQYRLVGICLKGVADQRIESVEGVAQDPEMPHERCRRIAVERRSDRA